MSFGVGAGAFFDGASIVRRERLLRYVWLPALASLLIVTAGLTLVFGYVEDASRWLNETLPAWLDFLDWLFTPLLYVVGVLVGAWLFGFLAIVVASPFMGDLARRVERASGLPEGDLELAAWPSIRRTLGREGRKLAYQLPRLILVFLVTLIPVINALSPIVWLIFGAWMMAVQFSDFPAENRGETFEATLVRLRGARAAALGFGGCVTLALAIPLVNFIVIPVAVAGGTLLWHRTSSGLDKPGSGKLGSE